MPTEAYVKKCGRTSLGLAFSESTIPDDSRSSQLERDTAIKYVQIFVLVIAVVTALLLGTADVSAVPGDEDNDGLIAGPRLVGNTTFRGCFASGPNTNGTAAGFLNSRVDAITDALAATDSWVGTPGPPPANPATAYPNMTELKNRPREAITDCINAAKGVSVAGDEFIFYFVGHGGDTRFADATENGERGGHDNHILIGDTTTGTRDRMTDDQLAQSLNGFKKSVTIVVILNSCHSHTFFDGANDLGSVTQKDEANNNVPAGPRLALIAGSSPTTPTCTVGFTDRLVDGLKKEGDTFKADTNPPDGVITAKEAGDFAGGYTQVGEALCDGEQCPAEEVGESTYSGPVPPEIDGCPTEAGPPENLGCPSDGGGSSAGLYAAIAVGVAVALAAGSWYGRRRWLR